MCLLVIVNSRLVWKKKHYIKENLKNGHYEMYKIPNKVEEIEIKVVCTSDCTILLFDELNFKNFTENQLYNPLFIEKSQIYFFKHYYHKYWLQKGLILVIKNEQDDLLDIKVYFKMLIPKLTSKEVKSTIWYGIFAIIIFCFINCFIISYILLFFIFGGIWFGKEKEVYKFLTDFGLMKKINKDE